MIICKAFHKCNIAIFWYWQRNGTLSQSIIPWSATFDRCIHRFFYPSNRQKYKWFLPSLMEKYSHIYSFITLYYCILSTKYIYFTPHYFTSTAKNLDWSWLLAICKHSTSIYVIIVLFLTLSKLHVYYHTTFISIHPMLFVCGYIFIFISKSHYWDP